MPLLFSYGTLQREDVQLSTFGRRLAGRADRLPRYRTSLVLIKDAKAATELGLTHYTNVTFTGDEHDRVDGMVLEVRDDELARADDYERDADYERTLVQLASGVDAWVYLQIAP